MEKDIHIVKKIHPVDEILPAGKMFAFGLQHVLAMYAGAIAVPIILAGALNLSAEQKILLINADLLACGIATLIQTLGFIPGVGAKIPMIQGVSFASVSPMLIIGRDFGLQGIYGAVIVAGIFTILAANHFSKLIRLFPPVVTGTVITTIGIVLMPVAINWSAGGIGAPDFGHLNQIALAAFTLVVVLLTYRYGKGMISNVAVLVGLLLGSIVGYFFGFVNLDHVGQAQWVAVVQPLAFGMPVFDVASIVSMIIVMLVIMVETTGDCIAIGEVVGKKTNRNMLARCLRADGLSTAVAAVVNSFPHSAFAQNVGLVAVTNVRSRYVVATSGLILIVLGSFPKLAAIIAAIPYAVLGGAGIAMFGMIIASGIRALARVQFEGTYNMMIVAVSLGFGLITIAVPHYFDHFPEWLCIILHSGITSASICAVLLNLFLNGLSETNAESDDDSAEDVV